MSHVRDSIWIRDAKAGNEERRYKMSIWLRDAEIEAEKDEQYWNDYYRAKEDVESGNIDAQNAIEVISDEELEIIAKALIKGEILDLSQFDDWRERAIEEEMKQRGF